MYSDRRGNGQKPPRTKPSRQKTSDKHPGHKPPLTIEIEFVQRVLVRIFCTRPTKMGGPRCMAYFSGVPGCVTKCDRGRGQNWPKIAVRSFWAAPKCELTFPTS